MKKHILLLTFAMMQAIMISASDINWKSGFIIGNPEIESISSATFGPENILFIGDALAAQVVAIDITEHVSQTVSKFTSLKNVDGMIADLLGADKEQIDITDMLVHNPSNNIFFAVQHDSGKSFLFKQNEEKLEVINLSNVSHSKMEIVEPISKEAKDRRERPLRKWAISDIAFKNGKIMLTGLSNKEFGSTFRSLDFPFNDAQSFGSLEIYHAAHGKYETNSPVKAFTTIELSGKEHVIASYTCTPLVVFPVDQLEKGKHTKGRTVAELGNWNTPLDIVELANEGERFVLIANSARALMKISVADIESFEGSLSTPVEERSGTAGVDFIALPFVNVLQLDKLEDDSFVMLQRTSEGDLILRKGAKRWL